MAVSVGGCANFTSVYRPFKTSEGAGALIDIKQRAIITAKSDDAPYKVAVCAEPSPDSLSAYAAEFAAKADLPNGVATQLLSGFQEGAAYTGLRTQSIQLLRDSLYRICEAYMNGAITREQYDLLVRRYQKYTVALLAIEQLTGAVKSPPITINTSGSAEVARSLSAIRSEIEAIDKEITDLEKKKSDSATTDEEKKSIETKIANLKADKEALTKYREHARDVLVTGTATSTVSSVGLPTQRSDQHIQAVSATVKEIVERIINTDDLGQLCFAHLSAQEKGSEDGGKLNDACSKFFENRNSDVTLRLKFFEICLNELKSTDNHAVLKCNIIKELVGVPSSEQPPKWYSDISAEPSRNNSDLGLAGKERELQKR
jgi:hypothetical protein